MSKQISGTGLHTVKMALVAVFTTTLLASASSVASPNPAVLPVAFDEAPGAVRDEPVSTADETAAARPIAKPMKAPALPADPSNPARRCGNVGNMMLDIDDLCEYASAMHSASTPR